MPERSVAQSVHAAMVLLGWAGLFTAGVCFPAMAILTHYYETDGIAALYLLGPARLFVGCFSSLVSIFFSPTALCLPLPNGSLRTAPLIIPPLVAILVLLVLRCYV